MVVVSGDVTFDKDEVRRQVALEAAIRGFPQGAGSGPNLVAAAKAIEAYLKGETPTS